MKIGPHMTSHGGPRGKALGEIEVYARLRLLWSRLASVTSLSSVVNPPPSTVDILCISAL